MSIAASFFSHWLDNQPKRRSGTFAEIFGEIVAAGHKAVDMSPHLTRARAQLVEEAQRALREGNSRAILPEPDSAEIEKLAHEYAKKSTPAVSPTEYPPGAARGNHNAIAVHFIALDFDKLTEKQALAVLEWAQRYEHVWWFSFSHFRRHRADGSYSLRLMISIDRPIPAVEWDDHRCRLWARLPVPPDKSCKDLARIYGLPAAPAEHAAQMEISYQQGAPLSVAEIKSWPRPAAANSAGKASLVMTDRLAVQDLKAVAQRLAKSTKPAKAQIGRSIAAIARSEPWSTMEGSRHEALVHIAIELDRAFPLVDIDAIAACCEGSLEATVRENPQARPITYDEVVNALEWAREKRLEGVAERAAERENDKRIVVEVTQDTLKNRNAVIAALQQVNADAPTFFVSSGCIATVSRDGTSVHLLEAEELRSLIVDHIRFEGRDKNGMPCTVKPPADLVADLMARTDLPFPVLEGVANTPMPDANGVLLRPGYNPESKLYLVPNFELSAVPTSPSADDIVAARMAIFDLLSDFPFATEADRANAIALPISVLARLLINGLLPMHVFEAPGPGAGKSKLVKTELSAVLGQKPPSMHAGHDEKEWGKLLLAHLKTGPRVTFFDNVSGRVDSAALASALTTPIFADRILSESNICAATVNCAWVMTSNNADLSRELMRRVVPTRLEPKIEKPWLRDQSEFNHADIEEYALRERPRLVGAMLTLIQAWLAQGRPVWRGKPLGSYEEWSRVVGGILDVAGIKGFLANLQTFYERGDSAGDTLERFVDAWLGAHGAEPVYAQDLLALETTLGDPLLVESNDPRRRAVEMGKLLKSQSGNIVAGHRIERVKGHAGVWRWRLQQVDPTKTVGC